MERSKQSSIRKPPNVDRLSVLPDEILSHILSFLPTKSSATTSILARRWRFLWIDVPTIDLYFYYWDRNNERPRISGIINKVLLGHNLKALNTFRLHHYISKVKDKLSQRQLKTWVDAVIAHGNAQNIQLDFSYSKKLFMKNYSMKLPECLFTCKSLVDLRLSDCEISISLPASICFPSLEKLHLSSVKYNNDETFQHLISGCSILEELVINYLVPGDLVCCRIFSPTLKWLKISFEFSDEDHSVEIVTPALRYLQVKDDHSFKCISAKPLSSLSEANIELERWKEVENDLAYSGSVLELLDRMTNVKCLKFHIECNKYICSAFSDSSPRFHNLTKLEMAADWRFIFKFLEMADNLQVLILDRVDEDLECWAEPQQAFTCRLSHLKSIAINYFCRKKYEYAMVRYLLKNAEGLTSMKIYCPDRDYKKKFDALQRISLFERGSKACKLDFK